MATFLMVINGVCKVLSREVMSAGWKPRRIFYAGVWNNGWNPDALERSDWRA